LQSEGIWIELKVLHQHGWSISQIAREFDLNWRTVKSEMTIDGPRHYPERVSDEWRRFEDGPPRMEVRHTPDTP
jgi:hypothetical protein